VRHIFHLCPFPSSREQLNSKAIKELTAARRKTRVAPSLLFLTLLQSVNQLCDRRRPLKPGFSILRCSFLGEALLAEPDALTGGQWSLSPSSGATAGSHPPIHTPHHLLPSREDPSPAVSCGCRACGGVAVVPAGSIPCCAWEEAHGAGPELPPSPVSSSIPGLLPRRS